MRADTEIIRIRSISFRENRHLGYCAVVNATKIFIKLIKPKIWERRGLKPWIEAAKKRLHPTVLAIALANKFARIAWGVRAHAPWVYRLRADRIERSVTAQGKTYA